MSSTTKAPFFPKLLVWIGLLLVVAYVVAFAVVTLFGLQADVVVALWQTWLFGGLALAGFGWFLISLDKRRR